MTSKSTKVSNSSIIKPVSKPTILDGQIRPFFYLKFMNKMMHFVGFFLALVRSCPCVNLLLHVMHFGLELLNIFFKPKLDMFGIISLHNMLSIKVLLNEMLVK